MIERSELARKIAEVSTLHGEFPLRSGQLTDIYFDKYRFECNPHILRELIKHLALLIPGRTQILAGLELGGVPLATALSLHTNIPVAYVRKEAKTHGTCNLIEGERVEYKNVLVIEDVISTAGQAIISTRKLENSGAKIVGIICVLDREMGGRENIRAQGWELISLFVKSDLQ